jgi:hypothetical protein
MVFHFKKSQTPKDNIWSAFFVFYFLIISHFAKERDFNFTLDTLHHYWFNDLINEGLAPSMYTLSTLYLLIKEYAVDNISL